MPQEGEAADGAVACTPAGCTIRISAEGPAAILLRPLPRPSRREAAPPIRVEPVCGRAAVIVSAEPVRGRCREVPVVDRFAVWRDGAHAIWLGPAGVRVLSDRAARGERPWVPGVPTPRARAGDEPAAELDPG